MPQARILEPSDTPHAQIFKDYGFRWCNKDKRWERNCKEPNAALEKIKKSVPSAKVQSSEPV